MVTGNKFNRNVYYFVPSSSLPGTWRGGVGRTDESQVQLLPFVWELREEGLQPANMSLAWCSREGHLVRFNIWHKYYQFIMKRNLNPSGKDRENSCQQEKMFAVKFSWQDGIYSDTNLKAEKITFYDKVAAGCLSTFLKEKCIDCGAMCPSCLPSSLITRAACQGRCRGRGEGLTVWVPLLQLPLLPLETSSLVSGTRPQIGKDGCRTHWLLTSRIRVFHASILNQREQRDGRIIKPLTQRPSSSNIPDIVQFPSNCLLRTFFARMVLKSFQEFPFPDCV